MSTIGENRLAVYGLLYEYPLYNYIKEGRLNILIIGNGWVGNKMFKAVFWCGQYPNVELNITIASQNAEDYKQMLLEHLPGLKHFADFDDDCSSKYHYANIRIRNVSFDKIQGAGITDDICGTDCLDVSKQNYIVVAVGDEFTNQYVAQSLAEKIQSESIINVFSPSVESEGNNLINFVFENQQDNNLEKIINFAKNINFQYEMKSNHNIADKVICDRKFDEELKKEFIDSVDETMFDNSVLCFLGKNYSVDSSLANAVHAKYKLHYCGCSTKTLPATISLANAINTHNKLYNELTCWEHQRWNAFMVIRGYRCPNQDELSYLYSNGNDHRDHNNRLHICMCDCGENGIFLSKHPEAWDNDFDDKNLSELDRASLFCHKKLGQLAKDILKKISADLSCLKNIKSSDAVCTAFSNYVDAIDNLNSNTDNAYSLYQIAYSKAKNTCPQRYIEKLICTHSKLKLLIEKSKKIDFFAYDSELIDMLPICRSMTDKNVNIVTILEKIVPTDLLIPWGLFPAKITFVFSELFSERDSYQNRIKNYFESHGNCTEIKFSSVNISELKLITDRLSELLDENSIIYLADNSSQTVSMAIGNYIDKHPIIYRGKSNKIVSYNCRLEVPSSAGKDGMNLNDYFELLKWESTNLFSNNIPKEVCEPIEDFYYTNVENWNNSIIEHIKSKKPTKGNNYTYSLSGKPSEKKLQDCFFNILSQQNIIGEYQNTNNYVKYKVINEKAYKTFAKTEGFLFKLLVYYKMLYSGLFEDVKTGIKFKWANGVENEIDEIAFYNLRPVFVSCKTTLVNEKNRDKIRGYIYEIASEAKTFNGIPILAISQNLFSKSNQSQETIIDRANAMGVAILDGHILQDENLLIKAIEQISRGVYNGPINFK